MYKHILFATDLTSQSLEVAKKAQQMAIEANAQFSIIYVIEPPSTLPGGEAIYSKALQQSREYAQKALPVYAEKLSIAESQAHIGVGKPKDAIADAVKQLDADLLVMASHGSGGPAHAMGSTTSATLHTASCDILVINMRNSSAIKLQDNKIF